MMPTAEAAALGADEQREIDGSGCRAVGARPADLGLLAVGAEDDRGNAAGEIDAVGGVDVGDGRAGHVFARAKRGSSSADETGIPTREMA